MARPTDYNEEILNKAIQYRDNLPEDEVVHSIEGLALFIGIDRSTIYEWIKHKDKEEFSYIVKEVLTKQGKSLVNNGLTGKFNHSISKVMMTKHGYREGFDQTTNDKDLPVPILNVLPTNNSNREDKESN